MPPPRRIRLTAIDPDSDELLGVTTVEAPSRSGDRNFQVVFRTAAVEPDQEVSITVRLSSPDANAASNLR